MSRGDGHDSATPFGESGTPGSENGAPVHEELSSKTAPAAQVNERLDFSGVICWRPSFPAARQRRPTYRPRD